MFLPESGKILTEVEGINCYIPEPGYIYNYHKKIFEFIGIEKNSQSCWIRKPLPDWWEEKRGEEKKIQRKNHEYFDPDCEEYREREWKRRLYGYWFENAGKKTYITGAHYFYIQWWYIGKKYPFYRNTDRRYFYLLKWTEECPYCYGMIDLEQRQAGKTYRSGLFIYDHCSMTSGADGGIQSKSKEEAKFTVYTKGILNPFLRLPDFFQPSYDKSSRLTSGMRFTPSIGMGSVQNIGVVYGSLGGTIGYEDSGETAYDGKTLERYVGDEIFKIKNVDIRERHEVILPMLSPEGYITGKALYTSTVEDIEGFNEKAIQMWKDSDQSQADVNNGKMTATGLIRFYVPAYENYRCDIHGFAPVEENKKYFLEERAKRAHNPIILNAYIRKHSFTWEEAFRFTSSTNTFNTTTLQEALDKIIMRNNDFMRAGNYEWVERDRKVEWVDDAVSPRIKMIYDLADRPGLIMPYEEGESPRPKNGLLLSMGCDPFDHYKDSRYSRYSNGASYLKIRYEEKNKDKYYNDTFILQYLFRTESPFDFFEDMIKICFNFSVPMLFEDQTDGIRHHFDQRGYSSFLQWLPGTGKPGVSASIKAKENMVVLLKTFFMDKSRNHYFSELIQQMFSFDILNTKKFDAVMGAGYTLMSEDSYLYHKVDNERVKKAREAKVLPLAALTRKYKIR